MTSLIVITFAKQIINAKFNYMKKLLLSMALALVCGATMAQTTNTVKFTFARTGTGLTDIPVNVTVNDVATNDITATLSASATNVTKLMGLSDNGIVCFANEGTGNSSAATEAAPHIYTLTINGLDGETLKNISIANKALTGGGAFQGTSVNRQRHYNVSSGTSTENLKLVEDRIDLISVTGTMGNVERAKDFAVNNVEIGTTLVIQLKMYNASDITGDDALGCFYGLTGFTLTTEVPEVETPEEPETPEVAALYHPNGTKINATDLMAVTEPTYIAIKGVAQGNHDYYNYQTGNTETSDVHFNQTAVFVWEPVEKGTAGSYYLRKLDAGYMQNDAPGNFADTKENAAVFTAVMAEEVERDANEDHEFNRDTNGYLQVTDDEGRGYFVRLLTGTTGTIWLNIGDHITRTQAPAFNNGRGIFTIYHIYALAECPETTNVTIKNTGDTDFATFYSIAPVELPENVTAYYVKNDGLGNGYVTLTADEDGIIPANTGVILATETADDTEVALTTLGANVAPENGNLLKGTAVDAVINETAYVLGIADGEIGLYKASTTGYAEGTFLNNAGKAYLPASDANGAAYYSFRFHLSPR